MKSLCICIVLAVAFLLALVGCNGPADRAVPELGPVIDRVRAVTMDLADRVIRLEKNLVAARNISVEIHDALPVGLLAERVNAEVLPHIDEALKEGEAIQVGVTILGGPILEEFIVASKQVSVIAKERDRERKRADGLEARLKSSAHSTLMWLIVGGVVLLAVSIFVAIKVDAKSGIALAVGSLMLIGASTFVSEYLEYIKWGAAALLLCALAVGGWWLWRYMKGFWQTGNVVEKLKEMLPVGKAAEFFAEDGPVRTVVSSTQSKLFHKAVDEGKIEKEQ